MPDLTGELRSIAEGVGQLVERIDQSLPEERMKELVGAAIAEEKRGRTRLIVAVVSPLIIVLAVGLATLAQSNANHTQGRDAKVVADYVRDCLQAPATKRDPVKCAIDPGGGKIVQGLVRLIACDLLAVPATQEKLDACAAKAFSQ